jgi:hypothetical protein
MNPFILGPDRTKIIQSLRSSRPERMPQAMARPSVPSPLALRLGRLLIRMGSRLAHEESLEYISKNLVN